MEEELDIEVDELVEQYEVSKEKTEELVKILANERTDETALKIKEQCILSLAKLYSAKKQFNDVMELLKSNNDYFSLIPKARTAKIVRSVLDVAADIPDSTENQIMLCRNVVSWCVAEKRTFLRQRIEGKLANLLLTAKNNQEALQLINSLLRELKKLDDKQMLTEAHLTEARIYHAMQNVPKAKAALTASRSASTSIYVVPLLQAELDEMSGMLQCEEGDTVTAFSYFLEAYEAFDNANDKRALTVLKYMALCKILNISAAAIGSKNLTGAAAAALASSSTQASSNSANEVAHLFTGKYALKHGGPDMNAMAAVAKAAEHRSLQEFKDAIATHSRYLQTNPLISHNLDELYANMFESNLLKIIHPYSNVELTHIAKLINLPVDQVERKLSQMILDNKLCAILDQGKGHLIVHDAITADANYSRALDVIKNIGGAVEVLSGRAKRINTSQGQAATEAGRAAAAAEKDKDAAAAAEKSKSKTKE